MKLTRLDDWLKLRADISLPTGMWIDGRSAAAEDGATTPLISPRDGEILTHLPAAGAQDVARAVRSAKAAFDSGVWSRISPANAARRSFGGQTCSKRTATRWRC